jgi:predicted kinase
MLILISGLPGTGKTTLAQAFAARSGALHLNSDLLRSELGLMGQYSREAKEWVYAALRESCRNALLAGKTVVVDSTFYKESIRAPFRDLAKTCGTHLRWVEVRAQESTIRERVSKPRPDSEADFAVYEKIRDAAEPMPEPHLVLWSDATTLEKMVDSLLDYLYPPNT